MIIVNGWKPLTIITKRSILDVAAVLDPPLKIIFFITEEDHLKLPTEVLHSLLPLFKTKSTASSSLIHLLLDAIFSY